MQLHCPNCRSPIPASDINIREMAAKCIDCQHLFFFDRDGVQPATATSTSKGAIELPDGMKVQRLLNELEISYNWRRHASGFLILFGLFWNAMLIPFLLVGLTSGQYVVLLAISLHLLIGIGLLYYILASLLNTTYVSVTPLELQVEHRPLPVPMQTKRVLSSRQIAQVYVKKYANGKTNGQPNWAYAVEVLLQNQAAIRLLGGLKTADFALYLEQEIERFLHIDDRRVKAEWSGPYA